MIVDLHNIRDEQLSSKSKITHNTDVENYFEDHGIITSYVNSTLKDIATTLCNNKNNIQETRTTMITIIDNILHSKGLNVPKYIADYNLDYSSAQMFREFNNLIQYGQNSFFKNDLKRYGWNNGSDLRDIKTTQFLYSQIRIQSFIATERFMTIAFDEEYIQKLYNMANQSKSRDI